MGVDENVFFKDLFNQLQKFHKIKHSECTHIIDFLEKIGFYRYTYFWYSFQSIKFHLLLLNSFSLLKYINIHKIY